jgi:hypothetical protein
MAAASGMPWAANQATRAGKGKTRTYNTSATFCCDRPVWSTIQPVTPAVTSRLRASTASRRGNRRRRRAATTATAATMTPSAPTVPTWASRAVAKARAATATDSTRGQVVRRAVQITAATRTARMLSDSDSERTDRFHNVTGVVVAKPRTTKTATTRRHPGSTSRPTVKASSPQAATATSDCNAVNPVDEPTTLSTKGTSGGRCPAQKPVLHKGWPATVA